MLTVAETPTFERKIRRLVTAQERDELILYLAEHPEAGVLIQGTGGIRKLRWAQGGKGKSGGLRVVYYFHSDAMPLYRMAAFAKNEKSNLSASERKLLAKMVEKLVKTRRQQHE